MQLHVNVVNSLFSVAHAPQPTSNTYLELVLLMDEIQLNFN